MVHACPVSIGCSEKRERTGKCPQCLQLPEFLLFQPPQVAGYGHTRNTMVRVWSTMPNVDDENRSLTKTIAILGAMTMILRPYSVVKQLVQGKLLSQTQFN